MSFAQISSPHTHGQNTTARIMGQVMLATFPGMVALIYFFGAGPLYNLLLAGGAALACEAAVLQLRGRPVGFYLRDGSALVTALLLALALPPYAPWWIPVLGAVTAILLAKQLYGGLGYNPFNPAMVGYVVLLISFPAEMSQWAAPRPLAGDGVPGLLEGWRLLWTQTGIDAYSGATPLELFRHKGAETVQQFQEGTAIMRAGRWAGAGWEWVNLAFLAGGAWLLYQRVFTWHAPVTMLLALGTMAALFYDGGSSASGGSPLFHWLSGGAMLGAFFIVTDPVTSATSQRGKLIFGAAVGVLIYVIRRWGNYPDAVAFAVLLMNFAAPFIDYYTVPRTYGHAKSRPGRGQ